MKRRKRKLASLLVFVMVLTTVFSGNGFLSEPARAAGEGTKAAQGLHVREWVAYEAEEDSGIWKPVTILNDAGYEVPADVFEEDGKEYHGIFLQSGSDSGGWL